MLNFCCAWQSLKVPTRNWKWLNFHRHASIWKWLTWQRKWLNFCYSWQSFLEVTRKGNGWISIDVQAFGSDWHDNENGWIFAIHDRAFWKLHENGNGWISIDVQAFGSDWQDNENIEFTLYRNFGRDWHDTENRLTLRYTGTLGKNWLDTGKIEITLYWNCRWDWHDTESLLTLRYTENLGETDPTAKRHKIYHYTWQNLFSSFGDAWNRRNWFV